MSSVVVPTNLPRFKNLLGKRFTRLSVTGYLGMNASKRRRHLWQCVCDCGTVVVATTQCLAAGQATSCGCRTREINLAKNTRHGMHKTAEYRSWANAKQRCTNENISDYPSYGGRGISMCDEWSKSFEAFYRDMGTIPTDATSIERIDVNGNYEPLNCKWANAVEQASNTRRNVTFEHDGRSVTLSEWSRISGIARPTIAGRLRRGWSFADAISIKPSDEHAKNGK